MNDKQKQAIEGMKHRVNLFFYNGMDSPHWFDPTALQLNDRLKGDLTGSFLLAYQEMIDHYTLEEMQENQPLLEFNIFVNPKLEQLQAYNKSILLDENQYLDEFEQIF